tara:strand:- start:2474 stop:4219 length:1746 start_codon:yes stop_codon:yes gene_type:complete
MAEKIILEVEVKSAKAGKDIKKVGDGSKAAATQTTLLSGAMNGVRTAMIAMKATSKLLFGSIKAGLISTGIGAFVVIIGSLITYLTNTKAGAEKLEQVMAGVGAAISVLTDRISMIGGAIAKVFSGDFKGAANDVKGALSGIADEIVSEANAASRLKAELQGVADATREFNIEKAQTNQEIAKALLLAEDETKSNEERLQGLKDALALEEQTTEKQLELQRRRVAAVEEEVGLGQSMAEDLDKLNDEKIRLIELETASIKQKKKVVTQVNAFELDIANQEKARQKVRTDAAKAETKVKEEEAAKQLAIDEKAIADKEALLLSEGERLLLIQQENAVLFTEDALERANIQLEFDRERALAGVADTEHTEALKAEINKKFNKKKQDQNKVTSEAERKLNTGDLASVGSMLGSIAGLQNEGTDAWKTTKIAEARINTFIGAQGAFNSMIGIPVVGQILAPIAAGIAILAGQKQVDAINATEIPKMARGGVVGGYGNGTSDSVNAKLSRGEIVINAKSAKMFRGALSNMNVAGGGVGFARGGATTEASGDGLAGLSTAPINAFVLTDSMSDSQSKLAKIRRRSKL